MVAQPPDLDVTLWRKARRPELIARRLALSAEARAAAGARITARLEAALAEAPRHLVGFYWPFKGEYDPRPLVRSLHQAGVALALPVVVAKAQPLIFRPWWPGVAMTPWRLAIPIPAGGEPVQPDTLLVPLVGFDQRALPAGLRRRLLRPDHRRDAVRPRTIGIGFGCRRLSTVHPQPYDIPMDRIVTDETD